MTTPFTTKRLSGVSFSPVGKQNEKRAVADEWTWADPLRPEHPEYYPNKIYLYSGQETNLYGHGQEIGDVKNILRKGHSQVSVRFVSVRCT